MKRFITLDEKFDRKFSKLNEEITESLRKAITPLKNMEITLNAFYMTMSNGSSYFISRVYIDDAGQLLLEHITSGQEKYIKNFNTLALNDKRRLIYIISKYGGYENARGDRKDPK